MQRYAFLLTGLFLALGCGGGGGKASSGVVTGKITYKGQPVNGATLQLYQTTGSGDMISILVNQEGNLRTAEVPAGEYKVVVQPSKGFTEHTASGQESKLSAEDKARIESMKQAPTITIPEKYTKRSSSDLVVTIVKGDNKLDLQLKD